MKDILDKTKTIEFLKNVISDKNIELEYVYGNKNYESKLENLDSKYDQNYFHLLNVHSNNPIPNLYLTKRY